MNIHQLRTAQSLRPFEGDIWERRDLSFKARAIYCYLSRFGGFLPKVEIVQFETGLGRDARRAAYQELRDAGLLVTRVGTWSYASKGGAL